MIAYLNNRSPLRLVQTCEYGAEEEGDEEAGEEESGGKPEDGFTEAGSAFAGFGVLRIASPRAETRTEVVGVDKTRGNHCVMDEFGKHASRGAEAQRQARNSAIARRQITEQSCAGCAAAYKAIIRRSNRRSACLAILPHPLWQ
jgi:hypothetical protein